MKLKKKNLENATKNYFVQNNYKELLIQDIYF